MWSAVRSDSGIEVAVKVTTPARYHVGALMELAARESAILDLVRHDHILRTHEVHALADGSVAVVLDLADGGTLARLVASRGRLRPGETTTVCTPIATALAALHRAGVVHGDVSPRNILLTRQGRPMLADFEAARLVGESRPPVVAGTSGFVAPELLAGSLASEATDVYALGGLAWFALTGRALAAAPGAPQGTASGQHAISTPDAREAASLVGPEFAEVVVAMLAEDPSCRPSAREAATWCYEAATAEPLELESVLDATWRNRPTNDWDAQSRAHSLSETPAQGGAGLLAGDQEDWQPEPDEPDRSVVALTQRLRLPVTEIPADGPTPAPPGRGAQLLKRVTRSSSRLGATAGALRRSASQRKTRSRRREVDSEPHRARHRLSRRAGTAGHGRRHRTVSLRRPKLLGSGLGVAALLALGLVLGSDGNWGILGASTGTVTSASVSATVGAPQPLASPPTRSARVSSTPMEQLRANLVREVTAVTRARATALMSGDHTALVHADVRDSRQWKADQDILATLAAGGQRYENLSFTVRSVQWVSGDETTAMVRAVIDRNAYRLVGPNDQVRQLPAVPGQPLIYTLLLTGDGWRLADVTT